MKLFFLSDTVTYYTHKVNTNWKQDWRMARHLSNQTTWLNGVIKSGPMILQAVCAMIEKNLLDYDDDARGAHQTNRQPGEAFPIVKSTLGCVGQLLIVTISNHKANLITILLVGILILISKTNPAFRRPLPNTFKHETRRKGTAWLI